MKFVLDPLSPTGVSKAPTSQGYSPYFKGGTPKVSLVDSVASKHGAVQLYIASDLEDVTVSAIEPSNPNTGDLWIDIS